jgi:hypothetical protein
MNGGQRWTQFIFVTLAIAGTLLAADSLLTATVLLGSVTAAFAAGRLNRRPDALKPVEYVEVIEQEIARARRHGRGFALAALGAIDLGEFQQISLRSTDEVLEIGDRIFVLMLDAGEVEVKDFSQRVATGAQSQYVIDGTVYFPRDGLTTMALIERCSEGLSS